MPRGKQLSAEEQIKIKIYKETGLSNREIAKRINRSHKVINSFFKMGENYGNNSNKTGNPIISMRTNSRILALAVQENQTAAQIKQNLDLPITKRRVQQILSSSGRFKWTKRCKKPHLTTKHKEKRLEFCQNHMS